MIVIIEDGNSVTSKLQNHPPHKHTSDIQGKQCALLACTICFPISDQVMFLWEFSFCFFISYAYMSMCLHLKGTIP